MIKYLIIVSFSFINLTALGQFQVDTLYFTGKYQHYGILPKKKDINVRQGRLLIYSVKRFDSLLNQYPGCGGSKSYTIANSPVYNKQKDKIYYRTQFLKYSLIKSGFIETVDFDFVFIYEWRKRKLLIYDNKMHRLFTLEEFEQYLWR